MSDISVSDIMAKETSLVVGVVQGAKEAHHRYTDSAPGGLQLGHVVYLF